MHLVFHRSRRGHNCQIAREIPIPTSVLAMEAAARILNSKAVILRLKRLLKALKTNDLFNFSSLNLQLHLLYKPKHLKNLQAHVYIHPWGVWSPARGVVDKTVDNFHPLTVNWLLGRLVNTVGNKANGA